MEGRCKDCTLDEKLKKLQVLRLIKPNLRAGCLIPEGEADCTLYREMIEVLDTNVQRRT